MLKLVLDLRWSLLTCDNHSCYLCRYLRNQTPSFSALLAALLPHFSQHDVVCWFISQALGVCECLSVCLWMCVCVCAFRLLCWAIQRNEKENPNSFSPPALRRTPLVATAGWNCNQYCCCCRAAARHKNKTQRAKNCKKKSGNSKNEPGEMKEQGGWKAW